MKILDVLNELEDLIENSTKVPLTGKILVDEEVIFDYIDRIRTALPEEIRQAKWINKEREKILEDARAEAARIYEDAQQQTARLAEESEVVQQANERAREIIEQAKKVAQEIRGGAMAYAGELLRNLQGNLEKALDHVQQGLAELKVSETKKQEQNPKEG